MTYRVLIVEDELPAREELAYMLGEIPTVEVIGEAGNGMDAVKKVKEHKPDLVFLDIELPDLTGIQVAEIIREFDFPVQIVFLTAYDHFAIEAFKLRAFHYILKPYDMEDLTRVFNAFSDVEKAEKANQPAKNISTAPKLAIETDNGIIYIPPKEIYYIEKQGREAVIHNVSEKIEANFTLNQLIEKLEPYSFFRTHKSYLVNLEHVKELRTWFNGSYNIIMCDAMHSEVPVSRNYVKALRLRLEL